MLGAAEPPLRRRPEGWLGDFLPRVRIIARISNIHFNRPFRNEQIHQLRWWICWFTDRSQDVDQFFGFLFGLLLMFSSRIKSSNRVASTGSNIIHFPSW